MGIEVINFRGIKYPKFQAEGYSAQYIHPVALKVCKGLGYDIGCGKLEWKLPGSIAIDLSLDTFNDATNLPDKNVDFIFSSHCLEHLDNWMDVLRYWTSKLCRGGVLFLYLPHYNQEYWRPWNNRKHKHVFHAEILRDSLLEMEYKNIFTSDRDANDSFSIFGEKR